MYLSGSTGCVQEFINGEIRHEFEECDLGCDLEALEWEGQKQKGAHSIERGRHTQMEKNI